MNQNQILHKKKNPAGVAAHHLFDLLQGQDCRNTLKMNASNKLAHKIAICDARTRAETSR